MLTILSLPSCAEIADALYPLAHSNVTLLNEQLSTNRETDALMLMRGFAIIITVSVFCSLGETERERRMSVPFSAITTLSGGPFDALRRNEM